MNLCERQTFERTCNSGKKSAGSTWASVANSTPRRPLAERGELGAHAQRAARGSDQSFKIAFYAIVQRMVCASACSDASRSGASAPYSVASSPACRFSSRCPAMPLVNAPMTAASGSGRRGTRSQQ